jgi:hypothetical protein
LQLIYSSELFCTRTTAFRRRLSRDLRALRTARFCDAVNRRRQIFLNRTELRVRSGFGRSLLQTANRRTKLLNIFKDMIKKLNECLFMASDARGWRNRRRGVAAYPGVYLPRNCRAPLDLVGLGRFAPGEHGNSVEILVNA